MRLTLKSLAVAFLLKSLLGGYEVIQRVRGEIDNGSYLKLFYAVKA